MLGRGGTRIGALLGGFLPQAGMPGVPRSALLNNELELIELGTQSPGRKARA